VMSFSAKFATGSRSFLDGVKLPFDREVGFHPIQEFQHLNEFDVSSPGGVELIAQSTVFLAVLFWRRGRVGPPLREQGQAISFNPRSSRIPLRLDVRIQYTDYKSFASKAPQPNQMDCNAEHFFATQLNALGLILRGGGTQITIKWVVSAVSIVNASAEFSKQSKRANHAKCRIFTIMSRFYSRRTLTD